MEKYGYANYAAHKAQHEHFVSELQNLNNAHATGLPAPQVVQSFGRFLSEWFVNHIETEDKAFGLFLGPKNLAAEALEESRRA